MPLGTLLINQQLQLLICRSSFWLAHNGEPIISGCAVSRLILFYPISLSCDCDTAACQGLVTADFVGNVSLSSKPQNAFTSSGALQLTTDRHLRSDRNLSIWWSHFHNYGTSVTPYGWKKKEKVTNIIIFNSSDNINIYVTMFDNFFIRYFKIHLLCI